MMKKNIRKIFTAANILIYLPLAVLLLFVYGGGRDYSLNQKEGSRLIGASYMTMNNEFYKILNEEISNRAELEEDRVILRDPALSAERQIEQIDEMIQMGIEVLVVTPVDWKSLSGVLKKAKDQEITVMGTELPIFDAALKIYQAMQG